MHPWAHAAGDRSVTDVSTDEFGYAQHVPNLSPVELADFISGKVLFEADFSTHVGYNPPTTFDCPRGSTPGTVIPTIVTPPPMSPMFTAGNSFTNMSLATIPRPGFTSSACFSCHHLDGKGQPAWRCCWHGGEAKPMHDAFVALSPAARAQLFAYVAYPFADPVPVRRLPSGRDAAT